MPLVKRGPHFTDVETEAQGDRVIAQGGTAAKRWRQGCPKTLVAPGHSLHYAVSCHLTTLSLPSVTCKTSLTSALADGYEA